jgi:uncharacterized protein
MLVELMLFPIVALEVRFLTPMLGGLNAAMATFIGNVISVFLLAWPIHADHSRGDELVGVSS